MFKMEVVTPYTLPAAVASLGFCLEIDSEVYGAPSGTPVTAVACGANTMNYR